MLFPEYTQCAGCRAEARPDARKVSCAACPIAEELNFLQAKIRMPLRSLYRTKGRLYRAGCAAMV